MKASEKNAPPFRGLRDAALLAALPTPCYVIDEGALRRNCEKLAAVAAHTGCKILLAQKAFSNFAFYPLLSRYLAGTEASGLYEARLGAEEMPCGEVHVFCAAYREDEFEELLSYADHIVFNSPSQLRAFGARAKARGKSVGLRVNPECSTQEGHEIYDPCAAGSRLRRRSTALPPVSSRCRLSGCGRNWCGSSFPGRKGSRFPAGPMCSVPMPMRSGQRAAL